MGEIRLDIKELAKGCKELQQEFRASPDKKEAQEKILQAFGSVGFAPYEVFNFLLFIQDEEILLRLLDRMRDDIILRRMVRLSSAEEIGVQRS